MRVKSKAAGSLLGLLMISISLAAGCGGGGQEQSGEQQGGQQGGQAGRAEPADSKIAIGTVRAVKVDKMRISLNPTTQDGEAEPVPFKVNKRSEILLNGQRREIGDVQGGQQAQVEYVERDAGLDRAISVELFASGGQQQPEGGESTN